jgi:hypothetical protein
LLFVDSGYPHRSNTMAEMVECEGGDGVKEVDRKGSDLALGVCEADWRAM